MSAAARAVPVRTGRTAGGVYFQVHGEVRGDAHGASRGDHTPLLLGFPLFASHARVLGAAAQGVREAFLAGLTDRYRVVLMDYPSVGESDTIPPAELVLDRVCADLLAVADAAGCERFAYWGATFGAVAGIALAARSPRVSALLCAGWSPLGLDYRELVRGARQRLDDPPPHARVVLRTPAQYAQWANFYASVPADWDAAVVPRVRCPRAVIYGELAHSTVGDVPLPLAATIRAQQDALLALGWRVHELPGRDAGLVLDPHALLPAARAFLDSVLPDSNTVTGEH